MGGWSSESADGVNRQQEEGLGLRVGVGVVELQIVALGGWTFFTYFLSQWDSCVSAPLAAPSEPQVKQP